MKRTLEIDVRSLIIAVVAFTAGLLLFYLLPKQNQPASNVSQLGLGQQLLQRPDIQREIAEAPKHGNFTSEEMRRAITASAAAIDRRPVSHDDVDWMLSNVSKDNPDSKKVGRRLFLLTQISIIASSPSLSDDEKSRIYTTTIPYLSGPTEIMAHMRDRRSIPLLLPYADSSVKPIRTCARFALKQMGVSTNN